MKATTRFARTAGLVASLVAAVLVFPVAAEDPAAQKSAEDILEGLLGGANRGVGGVRDENSDGAGGRIALPIQFEYNSATISESSLPQLEKVAEALRDERLAKARIGLEGHTDNVGSAGYNQSLSQRRANSVKKYLAEKLGIPASKLVAKGLGESQPVAGVSQDTEAGRAQHRRVEFVNLGLATVANEPRPAAEIAAEPPKITKTEAEPAKAPQQAEAGKLEVDVLVNYQRGDAELKLTPGSVLAPDDNFRVTFTPNRSSYVYVYHLDDSGAVKPVFPNQRLSQTSNPVSAGATQVIPPEGQWLGVGDRPGEEQIVVLASENELPDPQALAVRLARGDVAAELAAVRGPAANPRGDVLARPPEDLFSYRLPFKHE